MLLPKPIKPAKKKSKGLKQGFIKKKKGKKTLHWEETRAIIFKQLAEQGITSCELQLEDCWGNKWLSLAHAEKRRNLTEETYNEVILACIPCHQKIEFKKEMGQIVRETIRKRYMK